MSLFNIFFVSSLKTNICLLSLYKIDDNLMEHSLVMSTVVIGSFVSANCWSFQYDALRTVLPTKLRVMMMWDLLMVLR